MSRWSRRTVGVCALMLAAAGAWAQPANDACESAVDISSQTFPYTSEAVSILGANPGAEAAMTCVTCNSTVWYKFRPTLAGSLSLSLCAADAPGCTVGDTTISVFSSADGTCGTLSSIGCDDDSTCGLRSMLSVSVVANQWYYIEIGKYGTAAPVAGQDLIQFYMTAPTPPPPDRWVEQGDAPETLDAAQVPQGSGTLGSIAGNLGASDADMYVIDICDYTNFTATMRGGSTLDTQLFLFDTTGRGVTFDDDSGGTLQSTLTSTFLTQNGRYYLAVSQFNKDPLTSDGLKIWEDMPYPNERTPDGPGAADAMVYWDALGGTGGTYLVLLAGACFPEGGSCPPCPADFDQSGGVDGADVEAFFITWEAGESCADTNLDGSVDGADVEAFFVPWQNGGC